VIKFAIILKRNSDGKQFYM